MFCHETFKVSPTITRSTIFVIFSQKKIVIFKLFKVLMLTGLRSEIVDVLLEFKLLKQRVEKMRTKSAVNLKRGDLNRFPVNIRKTIIL